jgi:peptide deformylase
MRANHRCVGLAAPQLGDDVRIVVVDVSEHPRATRHHSLLVLVNPVIKRASGGEIAREGCLSIPELTANVKRATEVTVEAFRPDGRLQSIEAEGFEARALQHEIDHLDGILFLDRVASLTTDVFRRKGS